MTIDAVITWVDGNDPVLTTKRNSYLDADSARRNDVASSTRYADVGELRWCIASINRFAPFIRKIFIVSDGQKPEVDAFMAEHFTNPIPIEIVDHKQIYAGYEQYLPSFNSLSIESMLWRIPGLSEHFIYFNDDFILSSPVGPEDFFTKDGGAVCIAKWKMVLFSKFLLLVNGKKNGKHRVTFRRMMVNATDIARFRFFYPRVNHTPRGLKRSYFETLYTENEELLLRNIKYKFRNADQYFSILLFYLDYWRRGKCEVRPVKDYLLYVDSKPKKNYIARKLSKFNKKDYKFCCFNSLDLASEEDFKMIETWLGERIFSLTL